ncbi:efflux RND transporter periplasmic adaptor subunit [Candidatus Pelagibacter sp. HIMB1321]|uniref:efflux RND transporter periplasmic adaptor subunit n=1 Tax=Candidatus Pelagibacter sp. HIMB1321 TaxID=1388755 RepID=UPI000A07F806|nr:efflux RND transporter periplasmic adaptor subunit [Candidatus Pelagibacter sp. HIMB1321]SMF81750.1 membrane fusion protein, multidrug efflux system [Candidatus Pelagibacter sp. HIMB1321]
MKRSTKIVTIITVFFLVITIVITARTMIGNHFKKKFSKRPPPGIIVTEVVKQEFAEKLETFGTAISSKSETFKIRKNDVVGELNLKDKVKKGDLILNLKSGNVVAPFDGVLGYAGLTEDIFVSDNIFIITLDDNSTIFSDIKVPESYAPFIKKSLPVEARVSSYKDKVFLGEIDFISSRINADTRSLLARIKINNNNLELLSGSLLEITVKFNLRDSLSVPDTSIMMEGEKSYIYTVSDENIANKTEVQIGLRGDSKVEILSGINEGDQIVAEGLKKVRPKGKIKPIKN